MNYSIKTSELIKDIDNAITEKYNTNDLSYKDVIDLALLTVYEKIVINNDVNDLIFKPIELTGVTAPINEIEFDIAKKMYLPIFMD